MIVPYSMPKWIYSPLSAIIFTIVGISILVSLQKTNEQLAQSAEILDLMRTEVATLENEVFESARTSEIASSVATKERIIRDELLQKRPGEHVVQLPNLDELYPEFDVNQEKFEAGNQSTSEKTRMQLAQDGHKSKTTLQKKQKPWEAWIEILL